MGKNRERAKILQAFRVVSQSQQSTFRRQFRAVRHVCAIRCSRPLASQSRLAIAAVSRAPRPLINCQVDRKSRRTITGFARVRHGRQPLFVDPLAERLLDHRATDQSFAKASWAPLLGLRTEAAPRSQWIWSIPYEIGRCLRNCGRLSEGGFRWHPRCLTSAMTDFRVKISFVGKRLNTFACFLRSSRTI